MECLRSSIVANSTQNPVYLHSYNLEMSERIIVGRLELWLSEYPIYKVLVAILHVLEQFRIENAHFDRILVPHPAQNVNSGNTNHEAF